MQDLVCGIDVGTSAVRVLLVGLDGRTAAAAACDLAPVRVDGPRREQDPEDWWRAVCQALRTALARVETAAVRAVCVDATSGTILLVDGTLRPLTPGLMYNDGRATSLAVRLNAAAGEFTARHGYRFKDDFALAKLLWLRDHEPAFARAVQCLHQSDFVNARLAGGFVATDWSNALKTGCDLFRGAWPQALFADLGVPLEKLPGAVVAPGTRLGEVGAAAAAATGLRPGTPLVAGATDGTASFFASGACRPGDFNTSLGSTLILKGISPGVIHDPRGVIYCHRHPNGGWLPGGAGNVGCAALNREFAPEAATRRAVLAGLDAAADAHLPSASLVYPLGDAAEERFPFKKSGIRTLRAGPPPATREAAYAAVLQGIACVERWCYDELAALGARAERVFSTGGGSRSEVWCRLRADLLGRPLVLPEEAETALGAAVLAAGHLRGDLAAAAADMVRIRRVVEPSGRDFTETYAAFRAAARAAYGV